MSTSSSLQTLMECVAPNLWNDGVLSTGTFDGMHAAHLEHLRQASELGSLIVGVSSDEAVMQRKGKRVRETCAKRALAVSDLPFVEAVFINHFENSAVPIIEIKPKIYVRGPDYASQYDANLEIERAVIESVGGKLVFTTGPELHTSQIIERTQQLPKETMKWLSDFKSKYPNAVQEIEDWIVTASLLTASVIGENIQDEYVYVTPVGRSTKDPIVTFSEVDRRLMRGGSMAIHYHQAGVYNYEMDVSSGNQSITKTRYIVHPFGQKVYSHVKDTHVTNPLVGKILNKNIVTIADYGHGFIEDKTATFLVTSSDVVFVSLMVQANSLNWGFNTLNKYPHADFFVCNEPELRLAQNNNMGFVGGLLLEQATRLGSDIAVVTLGDLGCIIRGDSSQVAIAVPAFASKVVDRIGSGDAFLAIAGPLAALKEVPTDVIGFVGSVAAAIQVETIGNSEPITREKLMNWIRSLMA